MTDTGDMIYVGIYLPDLWLDDLKTNVMPRVFHVYNFRYLLVLKGDNSTFRVAS